MSANFRKTNKTLRERPSFRALILNTLDVRACPITIFLSASLSRRKDTRVYERTSARIRIKIIASSRTLPSPPLFPSRARAWFTPSIRARRGLSRSPIRFLSGEIRPHGATRC